MSKAKNSAGGAELRNALEEAIDIIESMQGRDNSCNPGFEQEIKDFRALLAIPVKGAPSGFISDEAWSE